ALSGHGGNPFFLTEALASAAPGVPTSVSDAVLARLARCSSPAQQLLEQAAVVPTKVERWVVEAALRGVPAAVLAECLAAGMLHLERGAGGFRHELARQAVEDGLAPLRRHALHAQVLHVLLERGGAQPGAEPVSLTRLAHHAAAAEDAPLVLRF